MHSRFNATASSRALLLCVAAALGLGFGSARAESLIFSTGEPTFVEAAALIYDEQWLAGKFTTVEHYTFTRVEAWLDTERGFMAQPGTATVALYRDGGDVPSTQLWSASFLAPLGYYSWKGAAGLSWDVPAGTYWISFAGQEMRAYASNNAPSPFIEGAYYDPSCPSWCATTFTDFGVRIFGDAVVPQVPEAKTSAMMSAGLALLIWVSARKRRRAVRP